MVAQWEIPCLSVRVGKEFPGVHGITVVSSTGGPRRLLATSNSSYLFGDPTWAPDGKHLLVARPCYEPRSELVELGLNGTQRVVFDDPAIRHLKDPVLSPDGKRIAFTAGPGCNTSGSDLWVMNADGHSPRRLAPIGSILGEGLGAVWSPDSRHLAYYRGTRAGENINVISTAGGQPHTVAKGIRANALWLSWYPR